MSVQKLTYTKDWNNPTDFPTIETSEAQVRADIQQLHDEAKEKINEIIDDYLPKGGGGTIEGDLVVEGDVNVNGGSVTGLAVPVEDTDAVNKYYVDHLVADSASVFVADSTKTMGDIAAALNAGKIVITPDLYFLYYAQRATVASGGVSTYRYTFHFSKTYNYILYFAQSVGLSAEPFSLTVGESRNLSRVASLASPTFTGTPTAPTAASGTNTDQIATTAFVQAAVAAGGGGGGTPSSTTPKMDGTASAGSENAYARGDHVHPKDTSKANLASPTFTGTPTAPTAAAGTNTDQIATTAFVKAAVDAGGGGGGTPSSTTPKMDGTASVGSETAYARGDHVHPTDTSRAAATHTHTKSQITDFPAVPTVTTGTATLTVAGWNTTTRTQSVTVQGVTTSNLVMVSPAPASFIASGNAQIRCTAQAANSLTFTCETVPTAAITVNVLILS